MFKSESRIKQKEKRLQDNYKQLLYNYPKLPVSKCDLYQIYFTYLEMHKMQDEESKLLGQIVQANQKAIFSQFKCFMHKIFENLNSIIHKIIYTSDLKKLDDMVLQNAPKFMIKKQFEVKKSRISKSSIQIGFTPGCEGQSQKINDQNKEDVIFGYLFQKIHVYLVKYKDFYQMQNVEELEMEIYQSFSNYVEENYNSMQKIQKKQSGKQKEQDQIKQKKQQKINQQKQKDKSNLVDQLVDVVIDNAEQAKIIKKYEESQQNKINGLRVNNYQISPLRIFGNAFTMVQNIYKQGLTKTLSTVIHYARDKNLNNSTKYQINEEQERMALKLYETILTNHKRHNLTKQSGLRVDEFKMVEQFLTKPKDKAENLHYLYTKQQKQALIQVLTQIVSNPQIILKYKYIVKNLQICINIFTDVKIKPFKQQSKISSSSKKGIKTTLLTINTLSQLPNTFRFIYFLYKTFQKHYSTGSRRILIRICHQIQDRFKKMQTYDKQYRNFCLVHALKILQSQNTKRSDVCQIITNQKPFRESQLPLIHEKKQYFEEFSEKPFYKLDQAQQALQLQLARIHIQQQKKLFKEVPKMQLLKLTHSKYRKTVTILISGFLSEDTNKFQQWMGALQPTYDSEIYALKWESKTIEHMLSYTIDSCKDIALAGAGIGIIGGPYFQAAMVLKQIITKYNQNPFTPCFEMATITGIFLGDLLISLFDDHFINLAGFSLGTQVISSVINRLKSKGKLHLINRIVTMGGVADKKQMLQILDNVKQNEQAPIQISWTNVYCEKDNILKYLLRLSMPSIDPLGLSEVVCDNSNNKIMSEIKKEGQNNEKVYEVDNINVTEFVSGHLSYRSNMKTIARLVGVKDE